MVERTATTDVPQIHAYAQIANQSPPYVQLETFDVTLSAYGSIGHFSCTTAISALSAFGWGPTNLLGDKIESSKPSLYDGSPTYPIVIYATDPYDTVSSNKLRTIFAGDIDELVWNFDEDELRITGRDYAGRLHDWQALLTPSWVNQTFADFANTIIRDVGLTPNIASAASVNKSLSNLLYNIGTSNVPGLERLGFNKSAISDTVSAWSSPVNMWNLLVEVARSIGFIVTVHTDGSVYVGPQGGDSDVNLTPRTFTWFGSSTTPNIVPIRRLTIDHGPRQYGTFAIRAFSFHSPSAQVMNSDVYTFSPNTPGFQAAGLVRQKITGGVYTESAAAGGFAPGKPNYYFYFQGKTAPQLKSDAIALAFDIAKYLYVVHGEIDGDPSLVPTTPIHIDEAVPGYLQGYANKMQLTVAGVNHRFDMDDGFLTRLTAWYAPSAQTLQNALPGEIGVQVTS